MKLGFLTAAAIGAMLLAQPAAAQVKIGVLNDQSGVYADYGGKYSVEAARMAIEDFGGEVLGHKIELVTADHQNKPDLAVAIARRWYDTEGVDMITELTTSSVALAVQELSKDKKKIDIVVGAATSRISGDACTPYSFHWAFDTRALAVGTGGALVRAGGDTWFFLTADYAFGYSLEKDASDVVKANGGTVVGSVRHPFRTPDLSSFILQAQASKAKIIGLASGPPDNVNAIKLGGEFGLFAGGQQMAGLLVLITDIDGLGLKTAQGLVLTTSFYWDMDDKTREWSKRFFAKVGHMPTMWQAGVYSSVMHYLKAIKAAGSDDPLKVAAKMRDMPIEDFFSRNGKLREDGLMVHDLILVQVKKPEESKYPWDYYQILAHIPGDQAFGPPNPACPLLKG